MKNLAWHFVGETLRNGDPIPKDGKWLEFKGPLRLCSTGLHFYRLPHQALQDAPGETLCLVEIGGEIIEPTGDDNGVCSRRKIIARIDATELLRFYARMQALKALEDWDTEPPDVVCDYLMTGDESIRNAAGAASVGAAPLAAAWDATRAAAADAAARAADGDDARAEFNALVYEAFADFLPGRK